MKERDVLTGSHINISEVQDMLCRLHAKRQRTVVVLDDDPTGIQTVSDVSVYMEWSVDVLTEALQRHRMFFLHTNTRAFNATRAEVINRTIMENLLLASQRTQKTFTVVSRGDSTLRGHYPLETQVLAQTYTHITGKVFDAEIMVPFFQEGGRITVDDVHYVQQSEALIPVAETEFAKDRVFGYTCSDLKAYIEEKTGGAVRKGDVRSVTLDMLRNQRIDEVVSLLLSARSFSKIIVNCTSYDELKVFVAAVFEAETHGQAFLFRTAASFVRLYGMVPDMPLLTLDDFAILNRALPRKVLVVVGSHVQKTRRQLVSLLACENVCGIKVDVNALLAHQESHDETVRRSARAAGDALKDGKSPVLYLSSTVEGIVEPPDDAGELDVSATLSNALVDMIEGISERPDCVIAKGGITSSDIAVKGLKIKRANVLGQVLPGIPVITTDEESKWPNLPYVIFPGNVGDDDALKRVYELLTERKDPHAAFGNLVRGRNQSD